MRSQPAPTGFADAADKIAGRGSLGTGIK